MGASESRMFAEYLEKERAKSRLVKMYTEESERSYCDKAVVVVSYRSSSNKSKDLVLEYATTITGHFVWALANYEEISSLVPASDGVPYGILQRVAATQLSLGRGVVLLSPIHGGFPAYVDGLREIAHKIGVSLAVIEFRTEVEDESRNQEYPNDTPHMIIDLRNGEHICFKDYMLDFFDELNLVGDDQEEDSLKLRHFTHPHALELVNGTEQREEKYCCSVCLEPVPGKCYTCSPCNHFLHESCAQLPQYLQFPFHAHPLRLINQASRRQFRRFRDASLRSKLRGLSHNTCRICNSEITSGPSYECYQCYKLMVHHQCAVSIRDFDHECHPHRLEVNSINLATSPFQVKGIRVESVSLASSCWYDCYACGSKGDLIFYYCSECKFCFHIKCVQGLPPSVNRKCPRGQPLLLSIPPKDGTDEYYCEVCAKMRHPDYWIYYCARCEYEAHPHCVVPGISPYVHPKPEEEEGTEKAGLEESESNHSYGNELDDDDSNSDSGSKGNEFMDIFRQQMGNGVEEMVTSGADGEVSDWLKRHMANLADETDRLFHL